MCSYYAIMPSRTLNYISHCDTCFDCLSSLWTLFLEHLSFRASSFNPDFCFYSIMKLILVLISTLASCSFAACTPHIELPAAVLSFSLEKRKFAIATDVHRKCQLDGSPTPPVSLAIDSNARCLPVRFQNEPKSSKSTIQALEMKNPTSGNGYSTTILVGTQNIVFLVDAESTD